MNRLFLIIEYKGAAVGVDGIGAHRLPAPALKRSYCKQQGENLKIQVFARVDRLGGKAYAQLAQGALIARVQHLA